MIKAVARSSVCILLLLAARCEQYAHTTAGAVELRRFFSESVNGPRKALGEPAVLETAREEID